MPTSQQQMIEPDDVRRTQVTAPGAWCPPADRRRTKYCSDLF